MEDNRVGYKELLMARSNKKCGQICREMWHVSEVKEWNRGTSKEVEVERGTGKTMDLFNSWIYN